jgi:hypothetical protein
MSGHQTFQQRPENLTGEYAVEAQMNQNLMKEFEEMCVEDGSEAMLSKQLAGTAGSEISGFEFGAMRNSQ